MKINEREHINKLVDFLKQEGLSYFQEARCINSSGKKIIVDVLYQNYKNEICCFEFKNQYTKINLRQLIEISFYKYGNNQIDRLYLITPDFCLDLNLIGEREDVSDIADKFNINPFDSLFDQYKVFEIFSNKNNSGSDLYNYKIDLNKYFIDTQMLHLFEKLINCFKDVLRGSESAKISVLFHIIKRYKEGINDVFENDMKETIKASDWGGEIWDYFDSEIKPKSDELLHVYKSYQKIFKSQVEISIENAEEMYEMGGTPNGVSCRAEWSIAILGILNFLDSEPIYQSSNSRYDSYQNLINDNIHIFILKYISFFNLNVWSKGLKLDRTDSLLKDVASIYTVKNSKVLSICGNGNALGLFIEQNNQLTEYLGPKDPDINTLLHHLIYIANGKNIDNISIHNVVDINKEYGCFDMVFKLDGVFDGRHEDVSSFIEALPSRLSKKGKAIILVPNSYLFTRKFNNLRSLLIDQNLLDIVIDVPNFKTKMLYNTNAKFSLIGIDMAKENDNVFFVDKQYDFQEGILLTGENDKGFPEGTNNLQYTDAIKNRIESHGLKSISCSIIKDNNYDLSVNRYVINDPEGIDSAIPLGDLFKELRISASSEINDRAFVLRIKNLAAASDTNKNIKIPFKRESLRRGLKRLDKDALLITNRFNELKPTLYRYDKTMKTPIYIDNSIIAFDVSNYTDLHLEALISELNSDFVRAQIKKYRVGSVMPCILKNDLLNIRLRDGDIETLKAAKTDVLKASDIKERQRKDKLIVEQKEKITNLDLELTKLEKYKDEVQVVEHDLNKSIRKLNRGNEKVYGNIEGIRLIVEEMHRYMKEFHSLSKDEEVEYDITSIDLHSFLDDFSSNYKEISISIDDSQLMITLDNESEESEMQEKLENSKILEKDESGNFSFVTNYKPMVLIDKNQFQKCLDNMMENFIEHAFKGRKGNKIMIVFALNSDSQLVYDSNIEVSDNISYLTLSFYNNGHPMDEKILNESFSVRQGTTTSGDTNRGRGRYIINKNMNLMGGKFDLKRSDKDNWSVIYEFILPIDSLDINVRDVVNDLDIKTDKNEKL